MNEIVNQKVKSKRTLVVIMTLAAAAIGFFAGGEAIRFIYSSEISAVAPTHRARPHIHFNEHNAIDSEYPWFTSFPEGRVLAGRRENAIVRAARRVAPSVVGIVVTQIQVVRAAPTDNIFDFFFGPDVRPPRYRQIENIGSGFIISEDGMILTNYHVVRNAARLYVNFTDGSRVEGRVVGVDEKSDIAVIAPIERGGPFKPVDFGDSDDCLIGEWSIALGNPFLNFLNDASPTLTLGVISALNRDFAPRKGVYYRNMIQTDAPINPGNSGGPLLNANAEVIGINSFIYTGSAQHTGSVGMGFAIPINRARRVAEELIAFGHRRPVWTGIAVTDLNPALAASINYGGDYGVVLVSVRQNSPGSTAGLLPNDVILSIDGLQIHSSADLDGFFLDYFAGDTVHIEFSRNGRVITTTLQLEELREVK